MELSHVPTDSKRLNVLTLDGGGVRGLSSLLILEDLMAKINSFVRSIRPDHREVLPSDIFDLVAGTSTGGLIAIMLGKLGMTLSDCIEAYNDLAETIFGKKHLRGILTAGLAPSKFSGSNLRNRVGDLVARKRGDRDLKMASGYNDDTIACAVVCREHKNESRYSGLKREAVCLCSSKLCPEQLECLVCDAARATSAAPTFFPAQLIDKRLFVDGGMEFNNPSHIIFHHYSESNWRANSKRASITSEVAIPISSHGNLNFSHVRFINIGTGTEPETPQPYQNSFFANLEPAFLRMGRSLKGILKESATNPENVADQMASLARVSRGGSSDVKYARFSADNGVYYIKMHKFQDLHKIRRLTTEYLQIPKVQTKLTRLANEIANEYIMNKEGLGSMSAELLSVPNFTAGASVVAIPQTPIRRPLSQKEASSLNRGNSSSTSKPTSSGFDSNFTNSNATSTSVLDSEDAQMVEDTPTKIVAGPVRRSRDTAGPAELEVDSLMVEETVSS